MPKKFYIPIFVGLILSLGASTCRSPQATPSSQATISMTPLQDITQGFHRASPLLPKAELLAFFAVQPDTNSFLIPVVAEKDPEYINSWNAFVGISLAERFRGYAEGQTFGYAWIHCKKGTLLPDPFVTSEEEQARTFSVFKVYPRTAVDPEDAYIFTP